MHLLNVNSSFGIRHWILLSKSVHLWKSSCSLFPVNSNHNCVNLGVAFSNRSFNGKVKFFLNFSSLLENKYFWRRPMGFATLIFCKLIVVYLHIKKQVDLFSFLLPDTIVFTVIFQFRESHFITPIVIHQSLELHRTLLSDWF